LGQRREREGIDRSLITPGPVSLDASISPVLSTLVALKFLLPGLSSEYPPPERDEPC